MYGVFMYEHFVVRYIITQMADNNIEINSGNKNKEIKNIHIFIISCAMAWM